jgi:hypothetical protein
MSPNEGTQQGASAAEAAAEAATISETLASMSVQGATGNSESLPAAAATAAAPTPPATVSSSKGTAKRDALRSNEVAVQKMWAEERAFESDPDPTRESFLVTFPYPYSNGHLHIGHAFSMTKAVFRAQFERNRGKNVLFPFAFHCTGMPIQAVRVTSLRASFETALCCARFPCAGGRAGLGFFLWAVSQ